MNGWYKPSRTGRTIVGLPTWMDSCRSANMSHLLEFTQAEPNSYDVLRCLNLLRYPCKDVYVNLWLYVYVSNFRFLFVYIDNFIFLATTCIYVCFAHIYIYMATPKKMRNISLKSGHSLADWARLRCQASPKEIVASGSDSFFGFMIPALNGQNISIAYIYI